MDITDPLLLINIVQYKIEHLNRRIYSFFSFVVKMEPVNLVL